MDQKTSKLNNPLNKEQRVILEHNEAKGSQLFPENQLDKFQMMNKQIS